ncbi:hypothetical protein [Streptomyces sp. AM6-12]|uniref:hypothetical protein n=1 Tax=Streptomyces sp. AM6-12 TaxID=3345149 RepID=UPI0037A11586
MIEGPIRSYIGQHSVGLSIPGSAVYTFWQFTGLIGLIGGFAGSTGARILWAGWGLSGVAMVWSATPDGSRTVATGIADKCSAGSFGACRAPEQHGHPDAQGDKGHTHGRMVVLQLRHRDRDRDAGLLALWWGGAG